MWLSFASSLFFLIPAYAAFKARNTEGMYIMIAASIASMIYHIDEEDMRHFVFDYFCVILINAFVWPLYFDPKAQITLSNLIAHALMAGAMYFWMAAPLCTMSQLSCPCNIQEKFEREADCYRYDWMHSCWHFCISMSLVFFIFSRFVIEDYNTKENIFEVFSFPKSKYVR